MSKLEEKAPFNWHEEDEHKLRGEYDWIGPDGCHYETRKEAWLGHLGFCGCAEVDEIVKLAIKLLEEFTPETRWQTRTVDFEKDPVTYYLLTQVLDKANIIEHGTSIRFPWLTEFGKQWLSMKKLLEDKE